MHVMMHLADLNLLARRVPVTASLFTGKSREMTAEELEAFHSGPMAEDPPWVKEYWRVEVQDGHSGKTVEDYFNDTEFAWLMWLIGGAGEDYTDQGKAKEVVQMAYDAVEPIIKDWPKECRPIP